MGSFGCEEARMGSRSLQKPQRAAEHRARPPETDLRSGPQRTVLSGHRPAISMMAKRSCALVRAPCDATDPRGGRPRGKGTGAAARAEYQTAGRELLGWVDRHVGTPVDSSLPPPDSRGGRRASEARCRPEAGGDERARGMVDGGVRSAKPRVVHEHGDLDAVVQVEFGQ